jgi:hypothetical protein
MTARLLDKPMLLKGMQGKPGRFVWIEKTLALSFGASGTN